MTATQASVIRLERSRARRAAEVAERAFADDPLTGHVLPEGRRRPGAIAWLNRSIIRYGLLYGEVYTTPDAAGVAVWFPPGHRRMTVWRMLRAGMWLAPLKLGWGPFGRLEKYAQHLERERERCVPGEHWYLQLLAVEPAHQGSGIGGALLRPVLARAAAGGLPCYLETMNEQALRFYGTHGFTVVRSILPPSGGPRFWSMVRQPPQPSQSHPAFFAT